MTDPTALLNLVLAAVSTVAGVVGTIATVAQARRSRREADAGRSAPPRAGETPPAAPPAGSADSAIRPAESPARPADTPMWPAEGPTGPAEDSTRPAGTAASAPPGPAPSPPIPSAPPRAASLPGYARPARPPAPPVRPVRWRPTWQPAALALTSGLLTGIVLVGQEAWPGSRQGWTVLGCWLLGVLVVLVAVATLVRIVAEAGWRHWRWSDAGAILLLVVAVAASPGILVTYVVVRGVVAHL
ncbi:hypothetical protein AB0J86_15315 [Micromonospora sp. NPDC049559]|uniref:hypothetical protein n=1 Tax=Micromonospora sp. NPDC049559 TaxID=3155923 RepID=UPI003419E9CD